MHTKLLLSVSAALLLAGCAAPAPRQAYTPPQAGPTASVTFYNATPGRAAVAVYEDAAACTGRRTLPVLLLGEQRVVQVPAGEPLAFSIRYTLPNRTPDRYCELTASFDAAAGEHYEARLKPQGENSCTVELARLVREDDGSFSPRGGVTAQPRVQVKSATEAGPFCTRLR